MTAGNACLDCLGPIGSELPASRGRRRHDPPEAVYAKNVGTDMHVSGVRTMHLAPDQHVCAHRHNQTGII